MEEQNKDAPAADQPPAEPTPTSEPEAPAPTPPVE